MASEFITRVEHGKDEPYTVIFRTDDADKYKHIEDECRRMIGHKKPTVDAVPVRCGECIYRSQTLTHSWCTNSKSCCHGCLVRKDFFCADGERKEQDNAEK